MKKNLQPHIMCGIGDIAKYVLVSGDPGRVEKIAALFDQNRKVAEYRGFVTYTGSTDGIGISACSTGIGCPSAAIVVEELARIGAEALIRVGTAGALQPDVKIGDLVVATSAVRADGTSKKYVPIEFPAVADFKVTTALIQAAQEFKQKVHLGPVLTTDAFYGDIKDLKLWHRHNVLCVEMESSVIFTLAQLRKLRVGTILAVDGNPLMGTGKGEFKHGEGTGEMDERVQAAIKKESRIAIEAIKILENASETNSERKRQID